MKPARDEAHRTLRAARRAAERGKVKRADVLVRVAEEFRLLAESVSRPVGFRKGGA